MSAAYKRQRSSNYYSPSYSSLITFSSSTGPTVFHPKRTTIGRSSVHTRRLSPRNTLNGFRKNNIIQDEVATIFDEVKKVFANTGKSLWQWMKPPAIDEEVGDETQLPHKKKVQSSKKRLVSEELFTPNKKKKFIDDSEIFIRASSSEVKKSKEQDLNEKLKDAIAPEYDSDFQLLLEKDPFKWDKRGHQRENKICAQPQYGTTFYKRRRKGFGKTDKERQMIPYQSPEEVSYLKMVFNGEYQAPKIIEDQWKEQLRLLEQDKARSESSSLKNSIINLTEKIKQVILDNQQKREDPDDLIFVKEQKVEPPSFDRKTFYGQHLKFDTSILTFEEEFRSYKKLLEERRKIQEEVRKKKKQQRLVPDLTKHDIDEFKSTLTRNDDGVLVNKNNIEVRVRDFKTLAPRRWLNDTIIEFFMKCIELQTPKTVAFNSFFYSNLSRKGYQGVRRWMKKKKAQITDLEKVFVPINLNQSHWSLGMIDITNQKILYVDSLSDGPSPMSFAILKDLQSYVIEESNGKLGEEFDLVHVDCPQQPNGFDCGIYVCMNTLYMSKDAPLTFGQKDAAKMRAYIGHLILSKGDE